MYIKFIVIFLLGALSLPALAEPQVFTSGPNRVGTVELYTSQGCSSCPPAERYLNQLRQNPRVWKDFIPMAFHVDYWNYLGWRDRFSKAEYSQRQRQYARTRRMNTVYTPGFFVDGREWRRGFSNGLPRFNSQKSGELTISVENQSVSGSYKTVSPLTELKLNTVVLGMGLMTDIKAGEREGHVTEHEFVVLGYQQQALKNSGFTAPIPKPVVAAKQYAVAVWISRGGDPTPIQAVGGMLKPSE